MMFTNLLTLTLTLKGLATYHTPHSGPILFPNISFPAIAPLPIAWEVVPSIPSTMFHSPGPLEDPSAITLRSFGLYYYGV